MKRNGGIKIRKDGLELDIDGNDEESGAVIEYTPMSIKSLYNTAARCSEPCWGCRYNLTEEAASSSDIPEVCYRSPGLTSKITQIWDLFSSNKGKMDDMELCRQIEALHKEKIYEPLIAEGAASDAMTWPADLIYRHFHIHTIPIKHVVRSHIRSIQLQIDTLENILFEENKETQKIRPNIANMEQHRKLIKMQLELLDRV